MVTLYYIEELDIYIHISGIYLHILNVKNFCILNFDGIKNYDLIKNISDNLLKKAIIVEKNIDELIFDAYCTLFDNSEDIIIIKGNYWTIKTFDNKTTKYNLFIGRFFSDSYSYDFLNYHNKQICFQYNYNVVSTLTDLIKTI